MTHGADAAQLRYSSLIYPPLAEDPFIKFLETIRGKTVHFFPKSGNAGDGLICHATYELFRAFDIDFIPHRQTETVSGQLVLIGGGGNLIEGRYNDVADLITRHISDNQVVLLPHSILGFSNILKETNRNLTIFCREPTSYQLALASGSHSERTHLSHDVVFFLNSDYFAESEQHGSGTLQVMRTDGETLGSVPIEPDNIDISLSWNGDLWTSPDFCRHVTASLASYIAPFSTVKTDRLHISILSAFLRKRVFLLPNAYFKNRAIYEHSLKPRFADIAFINTLPKLEQIEPEVPKISAQDNLSLDVVNNAAPDDTTAQHRNMVDEPSESSQVAIEALHAGAQTQILSLAHITSKHDDLLNSVRILRADLESAEARIAAEREMRLRAAERSAAARAEVNRLRTLLAVNPPAKAANEDHSAVQGVALHDLERDMRREMQAEVARVRAERDAYAASTSWRVTAPLRAVVKRAPGLYRSIRKPAKLISWTITLQLPRRLAARRQLIGNAKAIVQSGLFDATWYLAHNPDVAAHGMDPLYHYLIAGAAEGRDPSPRFSTRRYIDATPGLIASGANPLAHYARHHPGGPGNIVPVSDQIPPAPLPASAVPNMVMRPAVRLIYISGEPDTPGNIYRVLHYAAAAARLGIESRVFRLKEALTGLPPLHASDIVIVWRAFWDETVSKIVARTRSAGAKLVFDLDDAVINPDFAQAKVIDAIRSEGHSEKELRKLFERFNHTMYESDFCTASTEALAQEVREFQKTCFVLPNTFDESVYARSRLAARRRAGAPQDGLVRIGYAGGSKTHQKDFLLVADVLADLLRDRPNCRLVLFRTKGSTSRLVEIDEYPALAALEAQIEWRELVPLSELPFEVARFDINVAPLEVGNRFCEAKSELKYFEAAIAGVCTIASPTAPFRAAIRHGENGFLAADRAEWTACLTRLLDDVPFRREMARRAHHDALAQFGPIAARHGLSSMLEQAQGGESAARAFQVDVLAPFGSPEASIPVPASRQIFIADRLGEAEVTVIVPLYNYAKYIAEALDSVRMQTLQPLDLVVVDDCSTDDSLKRAVEWASKNAARFNRILVLQNESNAGLGPTRNVAFDAAETMYVLPLDADNRLLPECCEQLFAKLAGSSASYAYPVIRKFGESKDILGPNPFYAKRFAGGPFIDAMALIRKDAWSKVRGYADMRLGWEDYDIWCRMSEAGLWGIGCETILAEYRVHKQSMLATTTPDRQRRLVRDFERLHPWVRVSNQRSQPRSPAATAAASSIAPPLRPSLQALLPILRCPLSHQKLRIAADGTLQTEDGTRSWPIIHGRPVLFPGMPDPVVMPEAHLSNALEDDALQLIASTDGLVLNLSAGGTAKGNAKVVEVEAAVFRNTALVADSHALPFVDESFGAVIAMNAFEHYRDPVLAAREIMRVLRPGGIVLIRTAFLQPLHEKPWHFFNCTKYGMLEWFREFEQERIHVSANFTPNYAISWLLSEAEQALRRDVSHEAASAFARAPISRYVDFWRDEAARSDRLWTMFTKLSPDSKEALAAGFEYIGRKPVEPRVPVKN